MKKTRQIAFLFFYAIILSLPTLAQTPKDSLQSIVDSTASSDTILTASLQLFSADLHVQGDYLDNFIAQDLSDYVRSFRDFDLVGSGHFSSDRRPSLHGFPAGYSAVYQGDLFFTPQSVVLPFQTGPDFSTLLVEGLESVRMIESPLINLAFPDSKMGGVYLQTRDFSSGEPYSRVSFEQGSFGYRRTQAELGRSLWKKLTFYGAMGLHSSNDPIPNSDRKLTNLGFKLGYNFNASTRLTSTAHFSTYKRGLVPFSGWESFGLMEEGDYQKLNLSFYHDLNATSRLRAGLDFARVKQSLNQPGWETVDKVFGGRLDFYPKSLGRNSTKFSWNSYQYSFKDPQRHPLYRDNFNATNLFQITPNLWWLGWGNFEGNDSTNGFTTHRRFSFITGLSVLPTRELRLYATGGRLNAYPNLKEIYLSPRSFPVGDTNPVYSESGNLTLRRGYFWYAQSGIDLTGNRAKLGGYYQVMSSKRGVDVARVDTLPNGSWMPFNADQRIYAGSVYLDCATGFGLRLYTNLSYKTWEKGAQSAFLPRTSGLAVLDLDRTFARNQLGWKLRVETEFLGKRNDDGGQELKEVALLHAKASFRILSVSFYFAAENLTNQNYRLDQLPAPGRTLWGGLLWEFFD